MAQNYADAKYGVDQIARMGPDLLVPTVNGAALEELARFKFFTDVKVKGIRARTAVAGKADASGYQVGVLHAGTATASIGNIVVGTASAGSWVDGTLSHDLVAADELYIQNITATDTQSGEITVQYQERFVV